MLAFAESGWLLAIAVFLSGFAAALLAPAAQALVADLCESDRTGAFSLASMFRAAGELLGPLAGILLLGVGFQAVGVCSALIFAALFLLIRRSLPVTSVPAKPTLPVFNSCLLYTSDAADERSSVDLGGRRIIKKKKDVNIR